MFVYGHILTHTHIYMYIYICIHIYIYMHIYVYMCLNTGTLGYTGVFAATAHVAQPLEGDPRQGPRGPRPKPWELGNRRKINAWRTGFGPQAFFGCGEPLFCMGASKIDLNIVWSLL